LHLEPEEYLTTQIETLKAMGEAQVVEPAEAVDENVPGSMDDGLDHSAGLDLKSIVVDSFRNEDWIRGASLRRAYLFYAIVVKDDSGTPVAFIKQTSPQRIAKVGGWLTIFDNTLRELESPVFVLDPDIDLILRGDELAIFRLIAFERLLSDLEISKALVPEHVETLAAEIPFAEGVRDLVTVACQDRVRTRRLLRQLSSFTKDQWEARTYEKISIVMEKRKLNRSDFFNEDNQIKVDSERVPILLDVLASRYYTSDFDDEEMRADKARRRST